MINREGLEDLIIDAICDGCDSVKDVWKKVGKKSVHLSCSTLWKIMKERGLTEMMREEQEKKYIELIEEARFHGCKSISSITKYADGKGEKLPDYRIKKILRGGIRKMIKNEKEIIEINAAQIAGILDDYVLRRAKEENPVLYCAWYHYPRRYAKMTFKESYKRIQDIYDGKKGPELAEKWRRTKQAVSDFRIRHGLMGRCRKYKTAG